MTAAQAQAISIILNQAQRILLAGHERPDGDALGSTLGIANYLRDLGKNVTVYSFDAPSAVFSYVPGFETITTEPPRLADFQVIIIFDCGDILRTRLQWQEKTANGPVVICFDHHPTQLQIDGHSPVDHPIVEVGVSSTCEMVFNYLKLVDAPITKDIATCLLTGICTDTGNFQNMATTETCLVAASKLLIYGASLQQIVTATFKNKSVGALKLWGIALSRLKKDDATGQVTTLIRQEDLDACGVDADASEGVSNFLNSLGEAKLILVLKEDSDGTIRGSYRTTKSDVDVSLLAAKYGGGGHKKAAGFTAQNARLQETVTGWDIVSILGTAAGSQ